MKYAYHIESKSFIAIPHHVDGLTDGYTELTHEEYVKYFIEPAPTGFLLRSNDSGKPEFVEISYEDQVIKIEGVRRALYTNVDALRNEAVMIRVVESDETKASDYEQQAIALYLKIRDENPWPISPAEVQTE